MFKWLSGHPFLLISKLALSYYFPWKYIIFIPMLNKCCQWPFISLLNISILYSSYSHRIPVCYLYTAQSSNYTVLIYKNAKPVQCAISCLMYIKTICIMRKKFFKVNTGYMSICHSQKCNKCSIVLCRSEKESKVIKSVGTI